MQTPIAASAEDTSVDSTVRYDRLSITLHWLTAALVVLLWGIAQVIDLFPRGPLRIGVRSTHIFLGVTVGLVLLVRIGWRAGRGRKLPAASAGFAGTAARLAHYGLYVLLLGTVALGIANVWVRGDNIFGWFTIPKFDPGNHNLREQVENLHAWFANTVLIVAGLHAIAALIHHFGFRDNVLRRMLR
jgi:cytochrome b561